MLFSELGSFIDYYDDHAEIRLTNGENALIDKEDTIKVIGRIWRRHSAGYVVWGASKGGKPRFEYLHRVILGAKKSEVVDHINGNRLDCRKANLRFATPVENSHNSKRHTDNSTGYKGVSYCKKRDLFYARIFARGKKYWLGYYATAEDAAKAYDEAAKLHHNNFAKTNFDESNS